jgi:TonB-linked SusC/RagA family outer membrane protein
MHTRYLRAWLGVCAVLVCAVFGPRVARAQATGTIRGHVVETGSRRPLGDVQITVNGTQLGAVTNPNGDYAITNAPAGSVTLQARRLGYTRRTAQTTVAPGTESRVDFDLDITATQLDAIVSTGTAGAVEKRTVGNAITQINAEDVTAKTNVTSITEILQARSPGVTINAGSGTPGTASDITIRGASSFSVTRPVVYIDGVRMSTDTLGNFGPSGQALSPNSGGQTANALNLVNPEDIESIEVIKGPAASTLYGADAAGGVIQIITKKGVRGQQSVAWSARVEAGRNDLGSIDLPTNYTLCDAAKSALPATWPGCVGVTAGTVLSNSPIKDDPNALRNGAVQSYLLSARGGGDRFSYYVSGAHDLNEGVLHNSYDKRNSLRANFGITADAKTDFQVNFGVFNSHLRLPLGDESAQGILFSSQRGRPGRVSTLAGQYFTANNQPVEGWFTVTPATSDQYDNETTDSRVTFAGTMNYQPFRWFRNRLTAGLDWTSGQATLFAPPNTPDLTGDNLGLTAQRIPHATVYTLDYMGSAEHAFGANVLSTTSFGSQVIANRYEILSANGRGLGSPDVTLIGSTTTIAASNTFSENNSVGYWIQEQVGWKNRLFLTAALRGDDNSSFGANFNAAYYPKASMSWIMSEEPMLHGFFDAIHADDFKFRAAYGEAGKAPQPYSATRTYTVSTVTLGGTSGSAIRTLDFGNPNLKPERGEEAEVGFEGNFLRSLVGVDFTYYNKQMRDVLFSQTVAPSSGFRGVQQANLGRTKNTGIELGLTATPVRRTNFTWDSRISLSTNRNKLVSFGDTSVKQVQLSGASYGPVQFLRPGAPIASYWARFPQRNADGTPVFVNGVLQLTDTTYIGPSQPTREIAFSNTFSLFKNLSIYSLFDYKGGHYNYRGAELYRCASAANCWVLNDPNTPATELPLYRIGNGTGTPFGLYIHKADFVKLRDVSVTYTLPSKWASRAQANSMSVTLAGHNLALWSDYPGPDPEVNTYGNRTFIRGDIYSMPMTRRLTAALNLTF